MRCEVCGKPAFVHLTQVNDGVQTDLHLCIEHAEAKMGRPLFVSPLERYFRPPPERPPPERPAPPDESSPPKIDP
jgi:hypothetical protein